MQAGRSGVTNLQSALKMYDFLENILYLHMYNEYITCDKSQHNNVNSYFASIAYILALLCTYSTITINYLMVFLLVLYMVTIVNLL